METYVLCHFLPFHASSFFLFYIHNTYITYIAINIKTHVRTKVDCIVKNAWPRKRNRFRIVRAYTCISKKKNNKNKGKWSNKEIYALFFFLFLSFLCVCVCVQFVPNSFVLIINNNKNIRLTGTIWFLYLFHHHRIPCPATVTWVWTLILYCMRWQVVIKSRTLTAVHCDVVVVLVLKGF